MAGPSLWNHSSGWTPIAQPWDRMTSSSLLAVKTQSLHSFKTPDVLQMLFCLYKLWCPSQEPVGACEMRCILLFGKAKACGTDSRCSPILLIACQHLLFGTLILSLNLIMSHDNCQKSLNVVTLEQTQKDWVLKFRIRCIRHRYTDHCP
jgi:hypothetical protein